jgi:hypothetical protein
LVDIVLVPTIGDMLIEDNAANIQFHTWMESISEAVNNLPPLTGTGNPEGAIIASVRRWFVDTDSGAVYFKKTGDGDTGWIITI